MVSYLQNQVTRDGRRRAPRHLIGPNYITPFPWARTCVGIGIVTASLYAYYRKMHYVSPQEQFIKKIHVAPYGVLGNQMSLTGTLKREAIEPNESIAITDPCYLDVIQSSSSSSSSTTPSSSSHLPPLFTKYSKHTSVHRESTQPSVGTSAAIYKWIGLQGSFPESVMLALSKVCDAKFYSYASDKNVIHVIPPDFREGMWSEREAAIELSRAYRNTLHEFVVSGCDELRLPPLSNGLESGPLYGVMPKITHEALLMAFEQLHIFDKEYLLRPQKKMDLCIFVNREWDNFNDAFNTLPAKLSYK